MKTAVFIFFHLVRRSLFIYMLLTPLFLYAQELRFDHLSVKQGLSQGNALQVLQDKFGFIWVATEDGLNLYDGYTFKIFRIDPKDSSSLSNNNIRCIAEDKDGNILVGTQNGFNVYNRELNGFARYLNREGDNTSLSHNNVDAIHIDHKNNIWIGTARGLNLFNGQSKTFKQFLHNSSPNSIADDAIQDVLEDSNNQLWVATSGGLSRLNSDDETFTNFYHDPELENSLSSNKTITLFVDKDKRLWVGTFDGGLNLMLSTQGTFKHFKHIPNDPSSLAAHYVYHINQNNLGELWVATDGGLNLLDESTETFKKFGHEAGNENSLSSDIVTNVTFDVNDRMWISTRYGGVNVYDKEKYGFRHFKYNNLEKNTLNNNNVTSFVEDENGNIWIGVDGGGLNYYDRQSGKFSHITNQPDNKNSLTNNKVLAIESDHTGGKWIGMWDGGVNFFDPKSNRVRRYFHDANNPNSISDNNIFDILVDKNGNVWIATFGNGLNKYNPETDDFTQYIHDPTNPNSISGSPIVYMCEDAEGKLWLATEQDGLNILDPATNQFQHITAGTEKGKLTNNSLHSLHFDARGRLWIGTNGGGLNLYDAATSSFTAYRMEDGLPNESILGILEDDEHNLWLSTNKGVCKFNPDSLTFKNYNESDGLQSDQFNRWAFKRLSSGELLFGGVNGFNLFNPSRIKDNQYKPPVYITDFRLFNKPVEIGEEKILKGNILLTKEISLSYSENFISFDFTALNYRQPEKNRYKYILEGLQDEWVDAGNERKVSFTNLNPGEYVFRVIASNNDGVWNNEGASIRIRIVPPFWRTLWFISLATLTLLSGLIGFFRYQKAKGKRQQEELQKIIAERTSEVQKQSDEIVRQREIEKVRNWITEGLAYFGDIISKHKGTLEELSHQILSNLVRYVKANQGTMAVAIKDDPTDEHLKIVSTFGVNRERLTTDRIETSEGLIGAAYHDKEKKYIENLPANYIKIESGLGTSTPAKLILLPLKTEDGEVHGVIELAFLKDVDNAIQEFLEKVAGVIALNVHAANLNHKTMTLLQQSKEQTEELQSQEEEMRQNMEELEATQEELRRREQEYQSRIIELEEELRKLSVNK